MTTRFDGIDISHWQGHIEWAKVPHLKFMAMKASEGNNQVDAQWATNHAGSAGKATYRFFYHFVTQDDPKAQAAHFKQTVGDLAVGDGVMVDVERWGTQVPILDPGHVIQTIDEITTLFGVRPLVYIGAFYPHARQILSGNTWFLPAWDRPLVSITPLELRVGKKAAVWQYASAHGHTVPGIGGGVKAVDSDMILDETALAGIVKK